MPTIKSLENEIKKYFVYDYRNYLEEKQRTFDEKFIDMDIDEGKFNNFTLGNFKGIIGIKEKMMKDSIISIDEYYSSKIRAKANTTYVIDKYMLKYLKEELLDLEKFSDDNIDEEIILYMKGLCEIVEDINKNERNRSAHEEQMSMESAERIINLLLFNKKILFRFFEKIKINN